jgi:hypothetical protein
MLLAREIKKKATTACFTFKYQTSRFVLRPKLQVASREGEG